MKRYLVIGLRFVLYCWFGFCVGMSFLILFPVIGFLLLRPQWYPYARFVRKKWFAFGLTCGRIQTECFYEEPLTHETYVITPNHTSKLDMMLLPVKLDFDLNFAADKSFRKIPLFGLFMRTTDIAVDLKQPHKAAGAFKQGIQQLRNGPSLVVFPEGTIARKTPKLSDFKLGAFKMAIATGKPVLPVTFIHTWELLPDAGPLQFKPGKVILHVHAPIATKGMKTSEAEQLKQQVYTTIATTLQQYGYNPFD